MSYPREKVVKFIEKQLGNKGWEPKPVGSATHYGKQELRALMDFMYGGPPLTKEEELK